jgi:hypothetical protein
VNVRSPVSPLRAVIVDLGRTILPEMGHQRARRLAGARRVDERQPRRGLDGRFMLAYDVGVVGQRFGNLIGIDAHAQIFNADGTASGSVFNAAPPAAGANDTGNRSAFENGGAVTQLHPSFALRIWETEGCAPLVHDGAELEAARSFLLERAAQLGHVITGAPDLRLIAAGQEIWPTVHGQVHRFQVPAGACGLRLVSRSAVPAEVRDSSTEHRRLGVAVSRIVYGKVEIPLTDVRLGAGWHDVESEGGDVAWRWTDGEAGFALTGGHALDIEVLITGCYWEDDRPKATGARSAAA